MMELLESRAARLRAYGAALALAAVVLSARSSAQAVPTLLLVSQPSQQNGPNAGGSFVDMAPHLLGPIREGRKYAVLVYNPMMPEIRQAIDAKTLSASDVAEPLPKASAHKIAQAVGASYILHVDGRATKDGVTVQVEGEQLAAQGLWNTVFAEAMEAPKVGGKKASLLEAIHLHAGTIAQRVNLGPTARNIPQQAKQSTKSNEKTNAKTNEKPANPNAQKGAEKITQQAEHNAQAAVGNERTLEKPTQEAIANQAPAKPAPNISTYDLLIERARRNGDTANLIVALRRAINDQPRDVRLRRDLVQAYNDRGWSDMAREEALRAVALAPNDGALHRLLGEALLDAGEIEPAIKEFQEAVRLEPKDSTAVVALGDAYWNSGKPDEAQKAYAAAAEVDPKHPLPHRRLAKIYIQRSRYTDCIAELGQVKALLPPEAAGELNNDCAAILTVVDRNLSDLLSKMQTDRAGFASGTRNREDTYKAFTAHRKRAEEMVAFLEAIPDSIYGRVQALYLQAAGMIVQSSDRLVEFLETQTSRLEEESTLLRREAAKQVAEANKAMQALSAKPTK